tara:strand:+ start:1277 stop:1474 length:198 start_codon:yes stop_codon:yes gene_type:complete
MVGWAFDGGPLTRSRKTFLEQNLGFVEYEDASNYADETGAELRLKLWLKTGHQNPLIRQIINLAP